LDKKGALAPDQLVIIVGAIAALVILILILVTAQGSFLNTNFVSTTSCWASNGLQCGGGLFAAIPSLCTFEVEEEPVDEERLAEMLRDTYWMYHRAECDYGRKEVYPVYSFAVEDDLNLTELIVFMATHNRGKSIDEIKYSDLNYIEENTVGNTICFDNVYFDEEKDFSFDAKKTYFIHYFDMPKDNEDKDDKIMVTADPDFDLLHLEDILFPEQDGSVFMQYLSVVAEKKSFKEVGIDLLKRQINIIPVVGQIYMSYKIINKGSLIIGNINEADTVKYRCLVYGIPIEGETEIELNE